ncbi:uncharacterized protein LOC121233546 [Aquila chrysaetos chrysaetos]|uniref:uncharacterized protein LOC121233546 n=1 Tax=Aquila chrysaetos chrysaetos TaxID=223781 RepID=UPI001B7D429E|nr:uncharacterized protein LOC121233546 [Aquila chrysaetos chrysaetos]
MVDIKRKNTKSLPLSGPGRGRRSVRQPCAGLAREGRGRPEALLPPGRGSVPESGGAAGSGPALGAVAEDRCGSRGVPGDYSSRRAPRRPRTTSPGVPRGSARERLHPGPGHCCGRLVAITGQPSPGGTSFVLQRRARVTSAMPAAKDSTCDPSRSRPPRGSVSPEATSLGGQTAMVKNVNMPEEMQQDAVECVMQSLEEHNVKHDIAAHVKRISVCS